MTHAPEQVADTDSTSNEAVQFIVHISVPDGEEASPRVGASGDQEPDIPDGLNGSSPEDLDDSDEPISCYEVIVKVARWVGPIPRIDETIMFDPWEVMVDEVQHWFATTTEPQRVIIYAKPYNDSAEEMLRLVVAGQLADRLLQFPAVQHVQIDG